MAMRLSWLGLVVGCLLGGCFVSTDPNDPDGIPSWLQVRIDQLASEPVSDPPASVILFRYRRAPVYYFPPKYRCCDAGSQLFSKTGTRLCSPDGGITGRGDGGCPDFAAAATRVRVVWADRRPAPAPTAGGL